jgi:alpha-mannosidase
LNSALQAISSQIDTRGSGSAQPIVLFNPHAWASQVPAEVELERLADAERLLDDAGSVVAHQVIRPLAATEGRQRIAFVAQLPPLGYRCYEVVPAHLAPRASLSRASLRASETMIETDRWRLEIDPLTGTIAALVDRRAGREVFAGRAARPEVAADPSDTWSHGLTHYSRGRECFFAERVRLAENGPLRGVIRADCIRVEDGSRLVQEYLVYRDIDRIDVRVTVDWRGKFEILKLRFPVAVDDPRATWEIPYGFLERPADGAEQPGQRWLDVTGSTDPNGESYGLSVLNDGKYSSDVSGAEIGLTVLRSPIYAHHDPIVPDPDGLHRFTDQGIQSFTYALLPHAGDWRTAATVRHAAELNAPPMVVLEATHAGPLPRAAVFVAVDPPNVIVEVVKHAEDGDDLVVRAYETIGAAVTARIELPRWGRAIDARFRPGEIKTFRVPRDLAAAVEETDLLERTAAEQAT